MDFTLPEPPDGSRIEWEYYTDLYAAWRDDEGAIDAGWDGDEVWIVYPGSVPRTWAWMLATFGESLLSAIILGPVGLLSQDLPDYAQQHFTDDMRRHHATAKARIERTS